MTAISPDGRLVPTRRMSFAASLESLPKHFAADGDLLMSHVLAVLSGVFPDGEDYFVRSVRHFRAEITDPVLKRQVAGFIGQEAIHGREHRALNDRLAELGYATKRIERFTKKGLAIRGRVFTPTANLAATAALEHFTATLAEVILSDDTAQHLIGAPEIRDVLLWHALEESEHKAVAFDVFKAIGASERTRRWTMNFTTVVFLGGMSLQAVISMLGDRATYQPGVLRASARRLKANPFFRREVWRNLRDYNRPDFHPDDHDTEALLDEWRERLFGPAGTLNDRLAPIA
jgi:predicted metal-dependent hydrolase